MTPSPGTSLSVVWAGAGAGTGARLITKVHIIIDNNVIRNLNMLH